MKLLVLIPLALLVTALLSLPAAWVVMLLLGAAHSLEPMVPALGFWVTWVLVLALRFAMVNPSPKG